MLKKEEQYILDTCFLNNLYDCYASLQTFLNFLIMKKEQKKKQNHILLKFSKKRGKKKFGNPEIKKFSEILDSTWIE